VEEGLDLALRLGRPFNLCWSLCGGSGFTLVNLGEAGRAMEWIAQAHAIAVEHGLGFVDDVVIRASRGYTLVEQGDYEEGYAEATHAVTGWRGTGGLHTAPYMDLMRSRALIGLGRFDDARQLLEETREFTDRTGHRAFTVEIYRVLGDQYWQRSPRDLPAAEGWLRKAIEVARLQDAKGLELRAATSLARVWQSQDRRSNAYELLAPIYDWFTEGFDTKDVKEAKVLLNELS
jgi:predicted ATPase